MRSREERQKDLQVSFFYNQARDNDNRSRQNSAEDKPIFWKFEKYDPDKEIMYWLEDK